MKIYRPVTLAILFLSLCIIINCAYAQTFEAKIDSLIRTEFNDPNGPGGVFMVSQKGKIIYQKAYGKSNLEVDADLKTDNVFELVL